MKEADKLSIPTHVMARQVGDETVILDLATGTYFGLNPVGARLWQMIGEGMTLGRACDVLLEEFEVERAQLDADVKSLVADLLAKGLVNAG